MLFAGAALACGAAALTTIGGCALAVGGTAATGAVVAHDPRTTGTVVEDQSIELKAAKRLNDDKPLMEEANVSVTSYNQIVLLTGQAPTEELRRRAAENVAKIEKVRHIHNEIALSAPSSMMSRTNDTVLTTKVKTKLLADKEIPANQIKVVSEAGVVYLMGLVPEATADKAAAIASTTGGVQKVVKLFEYR
ncbi:MAG: BON domain-containing protein [Gammaproteobacteria bacterium]